MTTTTATTNPVTENTFAIVENVISAAVDLFTTLHGRSLHAIATRIPVSADTCGRALSGFLTAHRDPRADQPEFDLDDQARADLIGDLADVAMCVLINIACLDGDPATALTNEAARVLDLIDLYTPEGR